MAGTVDIVLRTFTGIRIEADTLTFRPDPPGALRRAAFELRYRDQRIAVTIDKHGLKLAAQPSSVPPARINVRGTSVLLGGGQTLDFPA